MSTRRPQVICDATNQSAATYYYPSSNGVLLHDSESLQVWLRPSANVVITVEVTGDAIVGQADGDPRESVSRTATWIDVTAQGFSTALNTTGTASFTNTNDLLVFQTITGRRFRLKAVISSATNELRLSTIMGSESLHMFDVDKAYDAPTQADRVLPMVLTDSKYTDPELIVDVASVTKSDSVSYYPASTGIVMDGYTDVAFDISAVAGTTTSPLYVWIEAADDNTFPDATALPATSPVNISPNCAVVNSAVPLGQTYLTVTAGAKLRALWQIENINLKYVRVCFLNPAANAANAGAVRMYARRKFQ